MEETTSHDKKYTSDNNEASIDINHPLFIMQNGLITETNIHYMQCTYHSEKLNTILQVMKPHSNIKSTYVIIRQ